MLFCIITALSKNGLLSTEIHSKPFKSSWEKKKGKKNPNTQLYIPCRQESATDTQEQRYVMHDDGDVWMWGADLPWWTLWECCRCRLHEGGKNSCLDSDHERRTAPDPESYQRERENIDWSNRSEIKENLITGTRARTSHSFLIFKQYSTSEVAKILNSVPECNAAI